MDTQNEYKVSISGEGVQIDKTVDASVLPQLLRLMTQPQQVQALGILSPTVDSMPPTEIDGSVSVKSFIAHKQPRSDTERVACLAFYLAHFKAMPQFKTIDLTRINTEAAQPKLANASYTARNAVDQQYLAMAGGGRKQIASRGEALVNALPDRQTVKVALEQYPLRGNKKKIIK